MRISEIEISCVVHVYQIQVQYTQLFATKFEFVGYSKQYTVIQYNCARGKVTVQMYRCTGVRKSEKGGKITLTYKQQRWHCVKLSNRA